MDKSKNMFSTFSVRERFIQLVYVLIIFQNCKL